MIGTGGSEAVNSRGVPGVFAPLLRSIDFFGGNLEPSNRASRLQSLYGASPCSAFQDDSISSIGASPVSRGTTVLVGYSSRGSRIEKPRMAPAGSAAGFVRLVNDSNIVACVSFESALR